jgi:hypothetical protein
MWPVWGTREIVGVCGLYGVQGKLSGYGVQGKLSVYVACMEYKGNSCTVLLRNLEERDKFEDLGIDERIILIWVIK